MNAMYDVRDFEEAENTYFETGDDEKIIDTFERQLQLLPYLKFTNFIMLGEPTPDQFVFLKHLVYLFKKKHDIEHVFVQSETGPSFTTWYMKSDGFTMMYDRDNIRGARPTIWSKINTSSVIIAPSVPNHILYQALNTTGLGLLICKDINDIVEDLRTQDLSNATGSILDFFERVRKAGYKVKMPLLEGGQSWCDNTSIHRVAVGDPSEETVSRGWTKMGDAKVQNGWNQWTCPETSVPNSSTPGNNEMTQMEC